jgi:hypothetical protein
MSRCLSSSRMPEGPVNRLGAFVHRIEAARGSKPPCLRAGKVGIRSPGGVPDEAGRNRRSPGSPGRGAAHAAERRSSFRWVAQKHVLLRNERKSNPVSGEMDSR